MGVEGHGTHAKQFSQSYKSAVRTAERYKKDPTGPWFEHFVAMGALASTGLLQFVETAEAKEGVMAFAQKRQPDFNGHRARASV